MVVVVSCVRVTPRSLSVWGSRWLWAVSAIGSIGTYRSWFEAALWLLTEGSLAVSKSFLLFNASLLVKNSTAGSQLSDSEVKGEVGLDVGVTGSDRANVEAG